MQLWVWLFLGMLISSNVKAAVIDVTHFGAIPDDGLDDQVALQFILTHLNNGDKVYFPQGVYHLSAELQLEGKTDIEIYGSTTGRRVTLMATGFNPFETSVYGGSLWIVSDCKKVNFHDLMIDVDKPVSINGSVSDIGSDISGAYYMLELGEEFIGYNPNLQDLKIMHQLSYEHDGTPNYHISTHYNLKEGKYPLIEKMDRLKLKIYNDLAAQLSIGEKINLRLKISGNPCFKFLGVTTLALSDITIWQWPDFAMYVSDRLNTHFKSKDMTLTRVKMKSKPGSARLMSISADGIHIASMEGTFKVRDCEFVGLGDDAINVHSRMCKIEEITEKTVSLINGWTNKLVEDDWSFPDDVIEFLDGTTGKSKGTAVISSRHLGRYVMKSVLKHVNPGDFVVKKTRTPSTVINNCTVSRSRARGFVLQSNDVIVSNNKFSGISGSAVLLSCDMERWFEATVIKSALVKGNTIENCGKFLKWNDTLIGYGAIAVKTAHEIGGIDKPAGVHRNITISKNNIKDCANSAIFVSSTDQIKIIDNRIENCSNRIGIFPYGKYAIYLKNCENDLVQGNKFKKVKEEFGRADKGLHSHLRIR
ncbi:Pectate lyase superfamily protein [Pedobacter sp. ok626]|nr:Pectate lyase superfamily protein [Pedobacter sp. ok626]